MKRKLLFVVIFLIIFFLGSLGSAEASEGVVELENVDQSTSRCYAMSTSLNRSSNFQLLIQCKELVYPIEPAGQFYILWANTVEENPATIRVGELSFGKISYNVRRAFSDLFVTQEQTQSPRQPSGKRVMEGDVRPIEFLQSEIKPTRKPTPTVSPKVTPTPQPSRGGSMSTIMLAIFIFIAIAVIVGIIVFIVNRLRNMAA